MTPEATGKIANTLANVVLKAMGFMFSNVKSMQKYLKTVDGWINFSIGLTTEDGSVVAGLEGCDAQGVPYCQKGFATQHTVLQEGAFDGIRVCGPGPMMKAVARVVAGWKQNAGPRFCEVSLENKMACGLGACLCCVTEDKNGHNRCVCTEGPVFNINELPWQI